MQAGGKELGAFFMSDHRAFAGVHLGLNASRRTYGSHKIYAQYNDPEAIP